MPFAHLPRIALAQFDVKTGRPDLNVQRMLEMIEAARLRRADIIAFSEMCVPGYIIGDLWEIDTLLDDYAEWSETLREASDDICVMFGNVVVDHHQVGEDGRARKYNAVRVCRNREWLGRTHMAEGLPPGTQPKTLHPNYRFFDDDRHFYSLRKLSTSLELPLEQWMQPFELPRPDGPPFRFGIQLCEDLWCEDYSYQNEILDTLRRMHLCGAEAVFNLSASPWTWQKNERRHRTISGVLDRSPVPFFYVNQIGAHNNGKNIIVFDGDTCAYAPDGAVRVRTDHWRESLVVAQDHEELTQHDEEIECIDQAILTGMRHLDHIRGAPNRFLIGVSGGIDSSVVLCQLVRAFGPERVFAVNMPTQFNAEVTQQNAKALCERLGVEYLRCPIQEIYELVAHTVKAAEFPSHAGEYTRLVDENIQARIRGADILAGLSSKLDLIYTNNGNKTEIALGYATLYGDVNGAIAPIADLYKTQIFELARYLNRVVFRDDVIPPNLYDGTTVPSAELSSAQDVTKGLGDPIKYGYHDAVLRQLIEFRHHEIDLMRWYADGELFDRIGWRDDETFAGYFSNSAEWLEDLHWLTRQLRINYFKRIQSPPIIVLSKRAFGFDLRESQLPHYTVRNYEAVRARVLGADCPPTSCPAGRPVNQST
ncbi:MAG: NAD(+) synthase [Pseudomonadota bacterium]